MPVRHVRVLTDRPIRHSRSRRPRTVARGVALSLLGVLVFGASAAAAVALRMTSNMDHFSMDGLVAESTPTV